MNGEVFDSSEIERLLGMPCGVKTSAPRDAFPGEVLFCYGRWQLQSLMWKRYEQCTISHGHESMFQLSVPEGWYGVQLRFPSSDNKTWPQVEQLLWSQTRALTPSPAILSVSAALLLFLKHGSCPFEKEKDWGTRCLETYVGARGYSFQYPARTKLVIGERGMYVTPVVSDRAEKDLWASVVQRIES